MLFHSWIHKNRTWIILHMRLLYACTFIATVRVEILVIMICIFMLEYVLICVFML